jgi:hypothetical protein
MPDRRNVSPLQGALRRLHGGVQTAVRAGCLGGRVEAAQRPAAMTCSGVFSRVTRSRFGGEVSSVDARSEHS